MPRKAPEQKPGKSRQDYETPDDFVEAVERRWGSIDWDLAALLGTSQNGQNDTGYYGPDHEVELFRDALARDWSGRGRNMWLNPPFARIDPWAEKCIETVRTWEGMGVDPAARDAPRIFMLTPASVATGWFADHVLGQRARVYLLSPRITFVGEVEPYPKDLILTVFGEPSGFERWRWKKGARG